MHPSVHPSVLNTSSGRQWAVVPGALSQKAWPQGAHCLPCDPWGPWGMSGAVVLWVPLRTAGRGCRRLLGGWVFSHSGGTAAWMLMGSERASVLHHSPTFALLVGLPNHTRARPTGTHPQASPRPAGSPQQGFPWGAVLEGVSVMSSSLRDPKVHAADTTQQPPGHRALEHLPRGRTLSSAR